MKKLVAADRKAATLFGFNVAICRNYAIAGAQYESTNEEGNNYKGGAGAAYIFKKIGKSWAQVKKIVHYDRSEEDEFGSSVAISDEYAMVGVPEKKKTDDGDTIFNTGAAYIFSKNYGGNENWGQVEKIVPSGMLEYESSCNVAMTGNYAVISAVDYSDLDMYGFPKNSFVYI